MKTILVVDDERHIVDLLRLYLEKEGFAVIAAADGEEALALHARHEPDLVVLDLMLPKVDGFEVCREIRRRGDTPVLMLTARTTTSTRSSGSSSAPTTTSRSRSTRAPWSPASRRSSAGPTSRRAAAGRSRSAPLRIDPRRREATVGDRRLDLRRASSTCSRPSPAIPGVVLTRDALLEDVWGTDFPGETRTVDVHVAEVRKKLGAGRPADRDGPRHRLPAGPAAARAGPADRVSAPPARMAWAPQTAPDRTD